MADRVRITGGLTVGRKPMTTVRGRGGGQGTGDGLTVGRKPMTTVRGPGSGQGTDNGRADSWPKTNDNCQGTGQRTGYG